MTWIQIAIIVLLIAVIISLASGFFYLFKEQRRPDLITTGKTSSFTKALYIRVMLAFVLVALIIYAVLSGQITPHAPWDLARTPPTQSK